MGGIVIVGGGLAAARTAEQLRRSEYTGPITIVSDEDHLPYDRPPLSKEVLRARPTTSRSSRRSSTTRTTSPCARRRAQSVDTAAKTLTLADGSELAYDELIIATGLVPKAHPVVPGPPRASRCCASFDESLACAASRLGAARGRRRRRASSAARWRPACAAWASTSSWWNRSRRRWRRCSASRSARWSPGCTAPRASTCDAASGWPRSRNR